MKTDNEFFVTFFIGMTASIILYIADSVDLIGFLTIFTIIVFFHLSVFITSFRHKRDYEKLNHTIEGIINDNLENKIITDFVKFRRLNANLNRLLSKTESLNYKKTENELTMQILTNNLTSPVIYIDRDGKIRYANYQFLRHFGVNTEINNIYETLRSEDIFKFVDEAFIFEKQISDIIHINNKYYEANSIPIKNNLHGEFIFIGILFIFHDITELKKYETLQREFLADASHELKTPISAIKGASEILLNGEHHSRETIHEFLEIMKTENERMEKMVNDILLISRIQNEEKSLKFENVDLIMLINQSIEILQFKLQEKKLRLQLDLMQGLNICGDYERLKQVLLNLLANAITYTDFGKAIFIRTYRDNNHVILIVKDEGIGIEEKSLPHIFKRFYRIDKARNRETGGIGLGLAIVKSILDMHKAKIEVKSKINAGAEFIIYFNNNQNKKILDG